jgi:nitrate reductase / nitrite oxidoreductase, alpha subunit
VTLDFRMSTTCLYSDIVLPTATWYEKNDLNTSDMHPFIHPLSRRWTRCGSRAATGRSTRASPRSLQRGLRRPPRRREGTGADAADARHAGRAGAALRRVKDWKKGECELIPGKTAPQITVVERDYPNVYKRFTALGPLMDKVGNGGKGIAWNTETEVEQLGELNGKTLTRGPTKGMPRIETDIDACEVILQLAPETNGHVAVKAWEALGKQTGRDHTHLALHREDEKIRFRDIQAQPRKIISSPTWSGIESETSLQRRLHQRARADPLAHADRPPAVLPGPPLDDRLRRGLSSYRPPVDLKTTAGIHGIKPNGNPEILLNFITPHQKWGIHSTYSDNLMMLTLNRGGPVVWLSRTTRRAPASWTTTGSSCSTSTARSRRVRWSASASTPAW